MPTDVSKPAELQPIVTRTEAARNRAIAAETASEGFRDEAGAAEAIATSRSASLAVVGPIELVHDLDELASKAATSADGTGILNSEDAGLYRVTDGEPVYRATLGMVRASSRSAATSRAGGPGAELAIAGETEPFDWHADYADVQATTLALAGMSEAVARAAGLVLDASNGVWSRRVESYGQLDVGWAGAVGDNVTDDTAAIQAVLTAAGAQIATDGNTRGAVVRFGKGTYITSSPLTFPATGTIILRGAGRGPTHLKNAVSNIFNLNTYSIHIHDMLITADTGGGHIVSQSGNTSNCIFRNVKLIQRNPAKSIWDNPAYGMLECIFEDFSTQHSSSSVPATVPTWNLRAPSSDISLNVWRNGRVLYSGNYSFFVGHTGVSGFNYGNAWENINFEVTNGGNIKLDSAYLCRMCNLHTFDLEITGATTKDLYVIGKDTASNSNGNVIEDVSRAGGTLGVGLYDIVLTNVQAPNSVLRNVTATAGAQINLGFNTAIILGAVGTLANKSGETQLSDGVLTLRELSLTRTAARKATLAGAVLMQALATTEIPLTLKKFSTSTQHLLRVENQDGELTAHVTHVGDLATTRRVLATMGLGVGNSAAASTLGTVTKKMEVFNASGVSLGFVPIYDAIT